ncbi:HupE/UreJ family protein [Pseudomonas sp. PB120]|uniref:HupE/UreJ family protein n=1 Tax=Pseudomonas sp. PB120 TaxID=2494700 RepID=UPI0012FD7F07|nr:HupE/UreJ family protein [Pseudomonas sp. PB120]MVV51789.1 HupE/UreJ family protein [Pseudomonas sp. PB120]
MRKTLTLVLLLIAMPAFAHPGHDGSPLQDGLLHPLTGLDHLLMLLGTGILAALSGRSLTLPVITLATMLCGALMGHLLGDLVGVQSMILVSLLVLCAAMLLPQRQALLAMVMPVFALFHGWSHGVEATPGAFWWFSAGFAVVSGLLLMAGFAAGCWLAAYPRLQKVCGGGLLAGAAIVLAG